MDRDKIEKGVRLILEGIGEDPAREGLAETPRRVADLYQEVFAGLEEDPADLAQAFLDVAFVHHAAPTEAGERGFEFLAQLIEHSLEV